MLVQTQAMPAFTEQQQLHQLDVGTFRNTELIAADAQTKAP